jgi:mitochondrial fission protein ELM1
MKQLWALIDHRVGTANQVLGVAKATGFNVTPKKLIYNRLSELPNGLHRLIGLHGLAKISSAQLSPPYPDLIISAGRRSAVVALALKRKKPDIKLAHLMLPQLPLNFFDLVILPSHDNPPDNPNVLVTLGAPNLVTHDLLQEAKAQNPIGYMANPRPWTMISLGGNTNFGSFTLSDAKNLVLQLERLANFGGSWLITSSRRTPSAVMEMFLKWVAEEYPNINVKSYAHEQDSQNPYYSWIAQADYFVITADSVTMISEAAFTTKPIYVFMPKQAAGRKHIDFVNQMQEAGHVKALTMFDENWLIRDNNLDEASRIANYVRELFF